MKVKSEGSHFVTMKQLLQVDGSSGEGGGQILRTSISLSAILGTPVEIKNIRSKRPKPGLQPQHLAAVKSVAELFSAKVENLKAGADWISFFPARTFDSSTRVLDIGTAGSVPLVLLSVIPAVSLSGNHVSLEIIGGTDVKASPTIDYLKYVVHSSYQMVGIKFGLDIKKRGYYPKGGGIVTVDISPCPAPEPADFLDQRIGDPDIISVCSGLPKHVADRQAVAAMSAIEKAGFASKTCTSSLEMSLSPGSSILVHSTSGFGSFIGGDCIGERGKPAEAVGKEAAARFLEVAHNHGSVDPFLADMLVIPLSLARGRSRLFTSKLTSHLITNLKLVSQFTDSKFSIKEPRDGQGALVEIAR